MIFSAAPTAGHATPHIGDCAPREMKSMCLPFGDPLQAIVRDHADTFRPGFGEWLADNRHVWTAFEREASRVWNRGRRHYSARTIVEVLRHESALADTGETWKLNDNRTPDLSRLYLLAHPERAGFFETRVPAASERAA